MLNDMIDDPDPHQLGDLGDDLRIRTFLLNEGCFDELFKISSDLGVLSLLSLDLRVVEALLDRLFPLEVAAGVIEELFGGTFGACQRWASFEFVDDADQRLVIIIDGRNTDSHLFTPLNHRTTLQRTLYPLV